MKRTYDALADLLYMYPTYRTCFKGFLTPQMRHLFRFSIHILALLLGAPGLELARPEKHSNFRLFGIRTLVLKKLEEKCSSHWSYLYLVPGTVGDIEDRKSVE